MDVLHPQLDSHHHDGREWPLLVWRSRDALRTVSSAPRGGGLGLRWWVLNAQVPLGYSREDPEAHIESLAAARELGGRGVGMLTAASLADVQFAVRSEGEGADLQVAATVGLGVPTWAAGDDPAAAPDTSVAQVGTINIVAFVPQRLSDAALVNAVGTVTEAKSQALWDAGVAATGTATDAVCICCPDQGVVSPFGGPRSTWGAGLARAVHRAVLAGARAWSKT